ncbi:MAG: trypsin-like serine protease [Proteobacteria bacterium]|nr:trypsin-like serine protease [Pseudomonadota bacterium]
MHSFISQGLTLTLLAPLALSVGWACSDNEGSDKEAIGQNGEEVIGGFPARSDRFNAIGALALPEGDAYSFFCSGTLIAPNAVLTAEHCVGGLQGNEVFLIGFDSGNPTRAVPIIGQMSETSLSGGFVGLGADVAVAFLGEPIEDIEPVKVGILAEEDIGSQFVVMGYGVRDNTEKAGQRYLGATNLRGIGGNHAENIWGSYEGFLEHFHELDDRFVHPDGPEETYKSFALLDGYDVSFGHAAGNAGSCYGDSGGPMLRIKDGQMTIYAVVSGGVGTKSLICDWGGVYTAFGPVVQEFIKRSLACPMIPEEGTCNGLNTAVRCATPDEGGYRPLETDCSLVGLVCAKDSAGEIGCTTDPCEGLPAEGICEGDVAIRCSKPHEGIRDRFETDCSILEVACGANAAGEAACVDSDGGQVFSCQNFCGGAPQGADGNPACYCDSACVDYGDCCADFDKVCEAKPENSKLLRPAQKRPRA